MADQKISAMPSATTPLTGAELVPLVQSGANVQSTIANFGQYARTAYFNHAAYQSTLTQSGSVSVGTPFTYNVTDVADGVTLANGSQLTVPVSGVYNFQWSAQFQNAANAPLDAYVWLRIDGVDVAGSAGKIGLPARKTPTDPFHSVIGWNFFLTLTAGQFVEIVWLPTSLSITVPAYPAQITPAIPATASVVVTVNQVG